MGMGIQARQLHSPQTSLGSLCACLCVCTPLCVSACVLACVLRDLLFCTPLPTLLIPQDAWLVWAPGFLFSGRREFPVDLPAENWLARMCIW